MSLFLNMNLLFRVVLMLVLASVGAVSGAPPKYLKQASKNLDRSDPIQVAIYQVLEGYPDFEAVLGAAYTQEEQERFIEESLAKPDLMGFGKMQNLQILEAMAPTLRHVSLELEGAKALYYQQDSEQPAAATKMKVVQWTYDVPLDEGQAFAHQLFSQVEALLRKDKKWLKSGTEDKALSPLLGSLSKVYNLSLMGSELIMVNVDYPHTLEAKEALGLRLWVASMETKLK